MVGRCGSKVATVVIDSVVLVVLGVDVVAVKGGLPLELATLSMFETKNTI